ncbi:MAG: hypothetical protein GY716_18775 [bacterium]|nr:hypothetical protein [bacterium]
MASRMLATLLLLLPGVALGQTQFNPYFTLQYNYIDNAIYLEDDMGQDTSDSTMSLAIALPVTRTWKTGSFTVRYEPTIERFDEFDQFDDTAHRASFRMNNSPSELSSISVDAGFDHSQQQGGVELDDPDAPPLTERVVRQSFRAGFGYDGPIGQRWNWSADARIADTRYDEGDIGSETTLEDRTTYSAGVGFGRSTTRTSNIGFSYELRRFDLEQDDETSHLVSFTARSELGRKLSIDGAIGGFYSKGSAAEGPGGEDDDSRAGGQLNLALEREFKDSRLRVDIDHRPTDGAALQGTSTNTAAGLSYAGSASQSWYYGTAARFTLRDPSDDDEESVDTFSIGGWLERGLLRTLAIRLTGNYSDQASDNPTLDGEFYEVGLGIVYYPRGRTQGAR